jgi:glycosyltransferase involved in cell wall biosynthesis
VKHVLMLAYVFPPMAGSGVQRTLKFMKYLPELGWRPYVITIKPYTEHVTDWDMLKEIPPEAQVERCYSLETRRLRSRLRDLSESRLMSRLRRMIEVPDHTIGWLPFAVAVGCKVIRENDISVLYSSFPPATALLVGRVLKKQFDLPWVVDFRDPWTLHPWFEQRTPRMFRHLHHHLERKCLELADRIIVTAPQHETDLKVAYPELDRGRFALITNGFDEHEFSKLGNSFSNKHEPFTMTYIGYVPNSKMLYPFLMAFKRCVDMHPRETESWVFQLIGSLDQASKEKSTELGLDDKVRRSEYIPHSEAIGSMLRSDLLLVWSWGIRNVYPAKVFEYLRAGKPILALASEQDDLARLIRESGAGIVVPHDDEVAIGATLLDFYKKKRRGELKRWRADDELINGYERRRLTTHLAAVFNEVPEI